MRALCARHDRAGERVPPAPQREEEGLTIRTRAPLGADLIIPGLALGFAVYFFFSTAELAWEAKANAVIIGTGLVILLAIQGIRIALQLARGEGDLGTGPVWQPREVLGRRIGMVLITAAFIATLPWLGLTLGTFLALAAGLYLMGIRKRTVLVLLPAIISATLYLLFIAVLDSPFPHGPFELLISALIA